MRKASLLLLVITLFSLVSACAGTTPGTTEVPTVRPPVATVAATKAATAAATAAATKAATAAATKAATKAVTSAATKAVTSAATKAVTGQATPAGTAGAAVTPGGTSAAEAGTPVAGLKRPEDVALEAAGGSKIGGKVTVLGTWGGSEQDSFLAMVAPFQTATGITVEYVGTRDLNAVLSTRVQGGNPPDLAGLPGPGQMAQFAQTGKLVDLSTVLDMNTYQSQYAKTWQDLGTVNNKLVGIFIKAAVKGLIWYDPKNFQAKGYNAKPATWNDLLDLSTQIANDGTTPWCIALESGASSGWPGTDWLEDIVLRQSGEKAYNDWWQGKLAWTSPQIKNAWQTWGKIAADPKMSYGGANWMLSTNFGDGGNPMFTNPPGCYMVHQGSFITTFFMSGTPGIKPVTDFDFFSFPPFTATESPSIEIAGDLFGMFNDTPQARALMKYLVSPEAQAIWVRRGGAISPNKNVPNSVYPDQLSQKAAELLTSAKTAVFDASDLMPDAMNTAFWKAILDYVQNPNNLDSILEELDSIRQSSYQQ